MRRKIVHKASMIREDGETSALCFDPPRAINMRVATWTNRNEAVTCKKCIAAIRMIALIEEPRP